MENENINMCRIEEYIYPRLNFKFVELSNFLWFTLVLYKRRITMKNRKYNYYYFFLAGREHPESLSVSGVIIFSNISFLVIPRTASWK